MKCNQYCCNFLIFTFMKPPGSSYNHVIYISKSDILYYTTYIRFHIVCPRAAIVKDSYTDQPATKWRHEWANGDLANTTFNSSFVYFTVCTMSAVTIYLVPIRFAQKIWCHRCKYLTCPFGYVSNLVRWNASSRSLGYLLKSSVLLTSSIVWGN